MTARVHHTLPSPEEEGCCLPQQRIVLSNEKLASKKVCSVALSACYPRNADPERTACGGRGRQGGRVTAGRSLRCYTCVL